MKKQDIAPKNAAGQSHGYWERYYSSGKIWFKGNYINGNL